MKYVNTALKVALLTSLGMVFVLASKTTPEQQIEKPAEKVATTTFEKTKEEKSKEVSTRKQPPTPQTTNNYIHIVEIHNTKNENTPADNEDRNEFVPPPTQPPVVVKETPVFTPPREMTPLEIAADIAKIYGWDTASIRYVGENKENIQVAYKGKQITVYLIDGWEEKLKLTINRVK